MIVVAMNMSYVSKNILPYSTAYYDVLYIYEWFHVQNGKLQGQKVNSLYIKKWWLW